MPIRLNALQIETKLRQAGFELVSQKGSHRKWKNNKSQKQVIVPFYKGKLLQVGTMMNIIKIADWTKIFSVYNPTIVLRLSSKTTSRHLLSILPSFSRTPTRRAIN